MPFLWKKAKKTVSQWSLTFEVRKRRPVVSSVRLLDGSQWSLTFEVRKRPDAVPNGTEAPATSQWSLTFEVRKRLDAGLVKWGRGQVAMEPDL